MTMRGLLFVCVGFNILAGCALKPSAPASHNCAFLDTDPHLSPRMSDDTILRTLGFEPARMKMRVFDGPDGYETDYTTRAGDSVSITRSLVTGICVTASCPNGSKWWEQEEPFTRDA